MAPVSRYSSSRCIWRGWRHRCAGPWTAPPRRGSSRGQCAPPLQLTWRRGWQRDGSFGPTWSPHPCRPMRHQVVFGMCMQRGGSARRFPSMRTQRARAFCVHFHGVLASQEFNAASNTRCVPRTPPRRATNPDEAAPPSQPVCPCKDAASRFMAALEWARHATAPDPLSRTICSEPL